MMRIVAFCATLATLAGAGLGAQALWLAWTDPPPPPRIEIAAATPETNALSTPAPAFQQRWPALFGEPQPPAPAPEPQPPAPPPPAAELQPPMPPLDSLGYRLNGVIRSGTSVWALVSHPTGELVLRAGDPIDESLEVARIEEAGIWVRRIGGTEEQLLAFPE